MADKFLSPLIGQHGGIWSDLWHIYPVNILNILNNNKKPAQALTPPARHDIKSISRTTYIFLFFSFCIVYNIVLIVRGYSQKVVGWSKSPGLNHTKNKKIPRNSE